MCLFGCAIYLLGYVTCRFGYVQVLAAFASAFHALQPAACPGFAFSWLELVSHRAFMPKLLLVKQNKGWSYMHRLLIDLLVFMEPHLRRCVRVRVRLRARVLCCVVVIGGFSGNAASVTWHASAVGGA